MIEDGDAGGDVGTACLGHLRPHPQPWSPGRADSFAHRLSVAKLPAPPVPVS